jgi:hypothetical protein
VFWPAPSVNTGPHQTPWGAAADQPVGGPIPPEEGLEETLTPCQLGVFRETARSLKTNNAIENLNSLVEDYIGNVKRWRHSEQRALWFALDLLEAEKRMNRIADNEDLPRLRNALQRELDLEEDSEKKPLSGWENQLESNNPIFVITTCA